jgi:hypothetical protein
MVKLVFDGHRLKNEVMSEFGLTQEQWFAFFGRLKRSGALLDFVSSARVERESGGERVKLELTGSNTVLIGTLTKL